MKDIAKVARNGRNHVVTLPEGFYVQGDELQVHMEGRRLVLEPMEATAEKVGSVHIPPGSYTIQTLPPLSDGAKAILASVDAAVAKFGGVGGTTKTIAAADGLTLEDEGIEGLGLTDEGLPGLDPGR